MAYPQASGALLQQKAFPPQAAALASHLDLGGDDDVVNLDDYSTRQQINHLQKSFTLDQKYSKIDHLAGEPALAAGNGVEVTKQSEKTVPLEPAADNKTSNRRARRRHADSIDSQECSEEDDVDVMPRKRRAKKAPLEEQVD